MRGTKLVVAILIVLTLVIGTVQPIMACSEGGGGGDNFGGGAPAKLAFIGQPSNTAPGASISPVVMIAVQDADGRTVTSSTLAITVVIRDNPSGGKLGGITCVKAVKGVATFANLSIDKPGIGYTLRASAGSGMIGTSNHFNIILVMPPVSTTNTNSPVNTTPVNTPVTTTTVTTPPDITTPVIITPPPLMEITVTGLITTSPVLIDQGGNIHGNYELKNSNGTVTLRIPNFNICWDAAGNPLTRINAATAVSPPSNDDDNAIVFAYTFGPEGAQFNPALTLTLKYDAVIPAARVSEDSLYAAGWDGTKWQRLIGAINTTQKTVTIQISHFSTYAIMGKVVPLAAAPTTTPAINQAVSSSVSIPVTTPSVLPLVATTGALATDPTTTQAPNMPVVVSPQPNHVPAGLVLVGIAGGMLVLLVVLIIKRRRAYD